MQMIQIGNHSFDLDDRVLFFLLSNRGSIVVSEQWMNRIQSQSISIYRLINHLQLIILYEQNHSIIQCNDFNRMNWFNLCLLRKTQIVKNQSILNILIPILRQPVFVFAASSFNSLKTIFNMSFSFLSVRAKLSSTTRLIEWVLFNASNLYILQ